MIITPNCQLFLDFQNNVVDKGHGGLTWTDVGSPSFTDGVIGRAIGPVSGTNHIRTAATTNPFNINTEFTVAIWFQIPATGTNKAFLDIGAINDISINNGNRGLDLWYVNSLDYLAVRVDNNTQGFGQNPSNQRGRYSTFYAPRKNTPVFFAATRTPTDCYFYMWDSTDGWQIEHLSYTAINSSFLWSFRMNRIGALGVSTNDNSLNVTGEIDWISKPVVLNKVLNFSDIKRVRHGMHPLNG